MTLWLGMSTAILALVVLWQARKIGRLKESINAYRETVKTLRHWVRTGTPSPDAAYDELRRSGRD